ncbi:hypothetical protein GCM10027399_12500 [Curvibacter fontanus]|jgi:hypothetical protein
MLKFFKSAPKPPATPARAVAAAKPWPAAPTPSPARAGTPPVPPPLPEVSEGNQESDWAMWEDSVAFQDSQMPSAFNELDAVKTHDETPKKGGGPDPFAAVRKRGS